MFSEAKVTEFFCIARNFSLNSCERCILHRTLLRSNRLYVRESVKDVFTPPKWHFMSPKWHYRNIH